MNARKFIDAWKTYVQLHSELQTYTDAEIAELGLTRRDGARIAFVAAFGSYRTPTSAMGKGERTAKRKPPRQFSSFRGQPL